MQRFVNNWSATLQAPLLAADGETSGFERVQAEMVAFADGYFVVERLRNTCMLRFYLMGNATPEFAILDLYHRPALPT